MLLCEQNVAAQEGIYCPQVILLRLGSVEAMAFPFVYMILVGDATLAQGFDDRVGLIPWHNFVVGTLEQDDRVLQGVGGEDR